MRKITQNIIVSHLIPVLSETEKQEMRTYYLASLKYEEEISELAMAELKVHPVFGKLIESIPKEIQEQNRIISRELQRGAICDDDWQPYLHYNMEQGIVYAKMGLDFRSWYEVLSLARKYLIPCLEKEFRNKQELLLMAINGMNRFFDIGMSVIGEAYMNERNEIIQDDREKIKEMNDLLETKVSLRTQQLETVNKELEAFSYSVSHDLRAPLRAISGYSEILLEDYGKKLDENCIRIIDNISHYATKMGTLIDELLALSKYGRKEIQKTAINMNELTDGVLISINKVIKHNAKVEFENLPVIQADYNLMYQIMFNLLSNAIKYSAKKDKPLVKITCEFKKEEYVFHVIDNGAGFDMRYADKLYGVFQRLHSPEEFEGSGVGLAIVHRLVTKHGGKVWAEGKVDVGAKFYFTIPK